MEIFDEQPFIHKSFSAGSVFGQSISGSGKWFALESACGIYDVSVSSFMDQYWKKNDSPFRCFLGCMYGGSCIGSMHFWSGGGIGETHLVIAGRELGQVLSPVIRVVPYEMAGSLIAVCGLEKYLNLQVSVLLLAVLAVLGPVPAFVSCLAAYCFLPYTVLAFALADRPYFSAVNSLDISYGIYLFSFPIQQILVQVFLYHGIALHVFALMVLSVLLSVAAGFLTERLVENPVQRLQKNMFC